MIRKIRLYSVPRTLVMQVPGPTWDGNSNQTINYKGQTLSPQEYAEGLAKKLYRLKFIGGLVLFPEYVPGVSGYEELKNLTGYADFSSGISGKETSVVAACAEPVTGSDVLAREYVLGRGSGLFQDKLYPTKDEEKAGIVPGGEGYIPGEELRILTVSGKKMAILICQDAAALFDPHLNEVMPGEQYQGNRPNGRAIRRKLSDADFIVIPSMSTVDSENPDRFDHLWKDLLLRINREIEKPIIYVNCSNYGGRSRVVDRAEIIAELDKNKDDLLIIN